jgi:hypothetical protein
VAKPRSRPPLGRQSRLPCQCPRALWQTLLAGLTLSCRPSLVARRERAGSGGPRTSSGRPGR